MEVLASDKTGTLTLNRSGPGHAPWPLDACLARLSLQVFFALHHRARASDQTCPDCNHWKCAATKSLLFMCAVRLTLDKADIEVVDAKDAEEVLLMGALSAKWTNNDAIDKVRLTW